MRSWSTYRVQLHPGYGFEEAADICEYLSDLGVSHLYCSPYLQAAPSSTHGYDVTDPHRLNDELGGAPAHAVLVGALRSHSLGQVLDIVPNHMSTDPSNAWWWDVLENGPSSPFASYFDIDWQWPDGRAAFKVLVPVLGDHYGRVLEDGQIVLERLGGRFRLRYFEHELPVSPRTVDTLLAAVARRTGDARLAELAERFAAIPLARLSDRAAVVERHEQILALAAALADWAKDPPCAGLLDDEVAAVNSDPDRLDELLKRQNYRLAHWRTASEELDYRRFFNIETLVGLRTESSEVFEDTHRLVLRLAREGVTDGLRVDHVDGLRDPEGYLDRLAGRSGGTYTVVEKILASREELPKSWNVAGTSGYDFLNRVNNLFVDQDNEAAMTCSYVELTGEEADYDEVVYRSKQQIMAQELVAEVERLTDLLAGICERYRRHCDHTLSDLRHALRELVAHFPVYRTYVHPSRSVTGADRLVVSEAVARARDRQPQLDGELLCLLGQLALGQHAGAMEWEFSQRLQQLTAPVMAKGVEDTAFYRYHRLVSLNEVGGNPGIFGQAVSRFHEDTSAVAASWPDSMLTLSTHDTKRGADVRARISALSEHPDAWRRAVERWMSMNESHKRDGWPEPNTEYLLYQTLVGSWPIDSERLVAYAAKATKEAKIHTSWVDPSEEYDQAVAGFASALVAEGAFVADLERFLFDTPIVAKGRRNSMAQTTLLLTCPGVPDIYQGTELWDSSLVDPDNRRPVDYDLRRRLLGEVRSTGIPDDPPPGGPWDLVLAEPGRRKLWLVHRLLDHRRAAGHTTGAYEPLALSGPRAEDAVAFSRGELAVVVPRRGEGRWAGTRVCLPLGSWRDVLTGEAYEGRWLGLDEAFAGLGVAVLARDAR